MKDFFSRKESALFWAIVFLAVGMALGSFFFAPLWLALAFVVAALGIGGIAFVFAGKLAGASSSSSFAVEELETILQNLHEAVIIYSPNFEVTRMNRAAEGLFQVSLNELAGRRIDPADVKNPHFRALAQVLFPSLAPALTQISEVDAWPQVVALTLEDPRREFVSTLHRIMDQSGALTGFLKIVRDRTREKSMLEAKTEFISVAAHQLRTPLTAIGWSVENLLKTGGLPDEATQGLGETLALAHQSLKITNDLLDASKIEEGKFGYRFEESDLVSLVKKILGEVVVAAKEYHVNVFFAPPERDPLMLTIDTTRIGTVLSNLVDNAIKYNVENGKVTVSITELVGQPYVKVMVEDTGIGVPPDEMGNLFQKLHRGSNAAAVAPDGTGLGLYIVKNIVRRHGGQIGADSVENRGSTFWFTLPTDPSLIPPKETGVEELI